MKLNVTRFVAPALFTAFAALPAAGQSYDITNISLAGATQWAIAGINPKGQVAGTTAIAGEFRAFFVTQADGTIDIGTLGGPRALAYAISGSGQVVGNSDVAGCCYTFHAFSWTKDGGMVDLGTLGGTVSDASAVNDSGTVVGRSLTAGNGGWHAYSWTKSGGMVDMGSLGGDSEPYAINASGQIVGTSEDTNGVTHAVLWNPGSAIKDLGILPGFNYAKALFISDTGQVAGYLLAKNADGTESAQHAFVYTDAAGLVDPGTLGGGYAWPVNMNASGRVIGISTTAASNSSFDEHAFTWTPAEGLTDLTLGGRSSEAFDVSSTGQVVGQSGTAAGTGQHAFSWTKSGGIVDLGTFGGTFSTAFGVNKWGQVVGRSALPGDNNTRAFLYDGGSVKDINDLVRNKPAGIEVLGARWLSDDKSMIVGTNIGFALLSPDVAATAPPAVGQISANDPVAVGAPLSASASFTDATSDSHSAAFTWGDGTPAQPGTVTEANGSGTAAGSHTFSAAGVYPVTLGVTDNTGLTTTVTRDVVVYDPAYGFVTGSGWFQSPAGAYKPDVAAVGRATFSFVSKYQKGAKTPTGTTDFRFQTVNLEFHSDTYDWLVVGGARAQFKGAGSLNDTTGYRFMLTAVDGQSSGGGGTDRFRIKIWRYDENLKQDVVIYDNQLNSSTEGTVSEGTALGAGAIVIHASKN